MEVFCTCPEEPAPLDVFGVDELFLKLYRLCQRLVHNPGIITEWSEDGGAATPWLGHCLSVKRRWRRRWTERLEQVWSLATASEWRMKRMRTRTTNSIMSSWTEALGQSQGTGRNYVSQLDWENNQESGTGDQVQTVHDVVVVKKTVFLVNKWTLSEHVSTCDCVAGPRRHQVTVRETWTQEHRLRREASCSCSQSQ